MQVSVAELDVGLEARSAGVPSWVGTMQCCALTTFIISVTPGILYYIFPIVFYLKLLIF